MQTHVLNHYLHNINTILTHPGEPMVVQIHGHSVSVSPRRLLHFASFEELGELLLQADPFVTNRRVSSMKILALLFQGRHLS